MIPTSLADDGQTEAPNQDGRNIPELFFGIVGPMGIGGDLVSNALIAALKKVLYDSEVIHVIDLLRGFPRWHSLPESPADERYRSRIRAGNAFCNIVNRGDALAVLSLMDIKRRRDEISEHPLLPAMRRAYILRSLKRPAEVETLRAVYGPVFFLIAAYLPRDERVQTLSHAIAKSKGDRNPDKHRATAEELVSIDELESGELFGQDVRETFPRADVFVNAGNKENLKEELERFIEIIFGRPTRTPTIDEHAMAHARIAALRSSDLSRQVGAAIALLDGTLISVGTNEVPKAGGGQFWEGDKPDHRTVLPSEYTSFDMRSGVLKDTLRRLSEMGWLKEEIMPTSEGDYMSLTHRAIDEGMKSAQIMKGVEFGRIMHAEMAALSDAVRLGVSVKGCTLYSTTFPCHSCTPHIVGAGINKVVYIHPYPKSVAELLFGESIKVDDISPKGGRVPFVPFVGVSPDRYFEFFNRTDKKETSEEWAPELRIDGYPESYAVAETREIDYFSEELNQTGLNNEQEAPE